MYEFPDGSVIRSDLPAARVAHIAISDVAIATGSPARNLQGAAVHTEASLGMVRLIAAQSATATPVGTPEKPLNLFNRCARSSLLNRPEPYQFI